MNQHFVFARVAYREEFVSHFRDECEMYSCDDMNKIRMGPATAVSRYHQIARFFYGDDTPNLGDHDFPNPSYLLVHSGYMQLSSGTYKETIDEEYTAHTLNDLNVHQSSPNVSDVSIIDEAVLSCDSKNIVADVDHDNEDNYFVTAKLGRKHYERHLRVQV